ncbi:MAG: glycosyltransferase family 2 protein [Bacteroidales bacterium]|jgi:dolichol-phosphate mannosyltransferase|nr:glycosyltransferase family 2 protein [Bacteroidales bacterium]
MNNNLQNKNITCSIVVSVYNEAENIVDVYQQLTEILQTQNITYEIIFVNDGSSDKSLQILKKIVDGNDRVKIISFSRNFGHEAAMLAGIDYSEGDSIVCMDADLQHPPTMLPLMLQKRAEGFEIINMVRTQRQDAGRIQNFNSRLFYRFLNKISKVELAENASDFFLISSRVGEILKNNFRERTRFLRGIIQMLGFQRTTLEYIAIPRQSGKSKYSTRKLVSLSLTAMATLSKIPLEIGIYLGFISALLSIALVIFSLIMKIIEQPIPGYTTLVVFMGFMFSIQFFMLGIMGKYIGFLFDETKQRPIYIIDKTINC